MSERVSSRGIWKSLFLFILSQLGIAILLHHEGAHPTKVLGLLTMPVILILFFLVYVGDDPKFAGFFFYWLGFLMAASIKASLPVRILIFIGLPAFWFFVYLDLRNVRWTLLLEGVFNMGKVAPLLLAIIAIVSLVGINYKLFVISEASVYRIFLIICEVIVFVVLYKLASSQNESTKKKIIKLTPWVYIFLYIQLVPTTVDLWAGLLLLIVGPIVWALLLTLVMMTSLRTKDVEGGRT
ncbi:hypothetical protein [Thermococcus thioreducens]|uniref:Uncharacterized protein n=1 Tax=Thermococcus thioreducens TaxID=277988 RepID=A0A0Q2RF79_9EURY|nr:hypothetical protein [Thermococcus thioreducens]ASJ12114.1 hypothetical protein A3L14_04115 [Thermococcus thioreducens]KQH82670.1 hypothetical protein AMR53_03450 [Thermococcus thioreducens]SEW08112.1 hypothetical protein SAMN05216170_1447 [Thermococcus thioreducens]